MAGSPCACDCDCDCDCDCLPWLSQLQSQNQRQLQSQSQAQRPRGGDVRWKRLRRSNQSASLSVTISARSLSHWGGGRATALLLLLCLACALPTHSGPLPHSDSAPMTQAMPYMALARACMALARLPLALPKPFRGFPRPLWTPHGSGEWPTQRHTWSPFRAPLRASEGAHIADTVSHEDYIGRIADRSTAGADGTPEEALFISGVLEDSYTGGGFWRPRMCGALGKNSSCGDHGGNLGRTTGSPGFRGWGNVSLAGEGGGGVREWFAFRGGDGTAAGARRDGRQ